MHGRLRCFLIRRHSPVTPLCGKHTADPMSVSRGLFSTRRELRKVTNTRAWRAAEIPAGNGHTTARALARSMEPWPMAERLTVLHLLNPATIAAAIVEQSYGLDAVLQFPTRFGSGLCFPRQNVRLAPVHAPRHPGRGGSIASRYGSAVWFRLRAKSVPDRHATESRLALAYLWLTRCTPHWGKSRQRTLTHDL